MTDQPTSGDEKPWTSCAQWPAGTIGTDGDISKDRHYTHKEAECICRMLKHNGFGGEGKIFPLKTWVEPTSGDAPTPETDAEQRQFGIGENRMYISADFARDLERRLAAATAERDEARQEVERLRKEREWQSIEMLNKSEMQFVLVYQDGAIRASLWNPMGYWETPMVVDGPTHWMPLPNAPKQKEGV